VEKPAAKLIRVRLDLRVIPEFVGIQHVFLMKVAFVAKLQGLWQ
jgi:hypothetical protein